MTGSGGLSNKLMYRILNINTAKNPGKFCLLLLAAALLACNKNTEKADVELTLL